MFSSVFTAILALAITRRTLGAKHINCHLDSEKYNVYVEKNAIYRCLGSHEVVDYCTYCNGNNGEVVSFDRLENLFNGFSNAGIEQRANHCNKRQKCTPSTNFIDDLCKLTVSGGRVFIYPDENGELTQSQCKDSGSRVVPDTNQNGYGINYPSYIAPVPVVAPAPYDWFFNRDESLQRRPTSTLPSRWMNRPQPVENDQEFLPDIWIIGKVVQPKIIDPLPTLHSTWMQRRPVASADSHPLPTMPTGWLSHGSGVNNREVLPNNWMGQQYESDRLQNQQIYKNINCNSPNEAKDVFIDGNSVFRCIGLVETFEYCIACDDRNDKLRGSLVSMDNLRKYAPNIKYGNETIQMQYCNVNMDRCSLPNNKPLHPAVDFCNLTVKDGTVRRYTNGELFSKVC